MEHSVGIAAIVVVGLMVGVEFSVAAVLNPVFNKLPTDGLTARSDGARTLGRIMPFWYFGSVAIVAGATALTWGGRSTWLTGTAGILLIIGVVMSIALLVPINSRIAALKEPGMPKSAALDLRRWDKMHHVRVAVILAAFVLLTVGVTI